MNKEKVFKISIILILIFGAILRLKTYMLNRPLWHDECSLAINIINRNVFSFFSPLSFVQSAPPIFMDITKIISTGFDYNELSLRFFPLLAGILSLIAFYYLSKIYFVKKRSIILANFLFVINNNLIYYSQEFKQYSSDVLFIILCLIAASKIDLKTLSRKKSFIYGMIAVLLPMISLPTLFAIVPYLFVQLIKNRKEVLLNLSIFSIPFFTGTFLYYIFSLAPSKKIMLSIFEDFWSRGFLTAHPLSILSNIKMNFNYFFYPNSMVLLGLILMIIGLYYFIKKRKIPQLNILFIFPLLILASYMHIYPLQERICLFLTPLIITVLIKPLDFISINRKIFSIFIISLTGLYFSKYNVDYLKTFFNPNIFERCDDKTIMKILKENYNPQEYVVINAASDSNFSYFSKRYGFYTKKYILIQLPEYNKDYYMQILDTLPKGYTYWFYYSYDYAKHPVTPFIKEWSKDKKVLLEKEVKGSYLLHLKNTNKQSY